MRDPQTKPISEPIPHLGGDGISYRELAEAMPQQVWTALPDGSLDYVNQQVLDYAMCGIDQLLGAGWLRMLHPDDTEVCVLRWTHSLQTSEPYEVEFRLLRARDNMYRWHLGRALPVLDSNGKVIRWLGTNTDIHDRKLVEAQLTAARATADEANHAKSRFLANVSHELRTPLNAVIGYSEMLQDDLRDIGATQLIPDIEKICRAGRYLLTLINDVLDLSKIEAGKMELAMEEISVRELFESVAETVRPLVAKNCNRLELLVAGDVETIPADRTKLRQCLVNLLSNAARFTRDGFIRLEAARIPHTPTDRIHLLVHDTGVGLTAQEIATLFAPFQQAHSGVSPAPPGGTGLGLAISRQLCRIMGGDISVTSQPGKGSTFIIELPAAIAE